MPSLGHQVSTALLFKPIEKLAQLIVTQSSMMWNPPKSATKMGQLVKPLKNM
uniref:Uncharacterized protein n=1 Tax=Helianthus annuus TaxID=4232 RepID=A0A251TSJ6_HELAN